MSSTTTADPVPNSTSKSKKKKSKKSNANKAASNGEAAKTNGAPAAPDMEPEEDDAAEPESPTKPTSDETPPTPEPIQQEALTSNGTTPHVDDTAVSELQSKLSSLQTDLSTTEERFTAAVEERDSLRAEVAELRKSLEGIQEKHEAELQEIKGQVSEAQSGKEHAETQYRTLLGKVNQIKAQLGERLKADAEELKQARERIEELEEQNRGLGESNEALQADISRITSDSERKTQDITDLRSRGTLSQQNWVKERDELIQREAYIREEFEAAKQAMQDWEVLAMEERSLRSSLSDRVTELEEQLSSHREAYEKAVAERDAQSSTVDGLQRALHDIQDARKKELREIVEHSQAQLEELRKQLHDAEEASIVAKAALDTAQKELERALPFEKEVKEKNLLIGKLRHEAVILNDHLTKALRFLKKGNPEDNVDRQIVTNHFLQFLALDRADPKKFQILQLIAALLGWTDEQREQAGLARPGASSSSLRIPMSPFRRTPSTPALNTDFSLDNSTGKESLAELWSDFLEREASESQSRRPSTASSARPA